MRKGFTLVELLIYVAIFASAAFLLTGTLTTVIRVQSREALSTDLSNQLTFILDTTTRLVRESSSIDKVYEGTNEASSCSNFCSVKLRMPISANDPTIIRSDANGIYLKQGAGTESILTNDKVEVANLILKQDTVQNAKSILNIDVALKTKTTNPALQVTRSLKSAIGRVSAATFDSDLIPNSPGAGNVGTSGTPWGGLTIGPSASSGTTITQIKVYAQAIDPPSVPAKSTAYQSVTVTGLSLSPLDKVIVNPGNDFAGSCALGSVRVSAANTLRIQYINSHDVSACDTASSTWQVIAIRSS